MSSEVTKAFVSQFQANAELIVQQMTSQFEDKVVIKPMSANEDYFDFIGESEPYEITSRHEVTVFQDTPHSRRKISAVPRAVHDLVDKADQRRLLIDPANDYLRSFRAGYKRKMDTVILAAAIGTAYSATGSGANLVETAIVLPSGQKVAETGTVGMTSGKLKDALQIYLENDVDPDLMKYAALSPQAIRDLLDEPDLTIPDKKALEIVQTGKIAQAFGFMIYPTNRLAAAVANIRSNVTWVREGIYLGMIQDIETRLGENQNYNHSLQISMYMDFGAARMQEEYVVEIQAYEA